MFQLPSLLRGSTVYRGVQSLFGSPWGVSSRSITFPRLLPKDDMAQDRAVVRFMEGEDKFTLSFLLRNEQLNIEKQFNTCRSLTESSAQFISRLNANVDKVVSKKMAAKKRKTAKKGSTTDADADADADADLSAQVKFRDAQGKSVDFAQDVQVKDMLFQSGLLMDVLGQEFSVNVNPPMVDGLKLSDQIMTGFPVYPYRLVMRFASREDTLFEWFVSQKVEDEATRMRLESNKRLFQWTKRGEGFFFRPQAQDIDRHLMVRCVPRDAQKNVGIEHEVLSKGTISAGPGLCPFENRHAFTQHATKSGHLRVLTYNLLADLYADSDYSRTVLHPQCPAYALNIDYRKQLLIKELLGYNTDLMCLEEVDSKIFEHDLKPVLSASGMEGVFDRKGNSVAEGVACFWRTSKFQLVKSHRVLLSDALQSDDSKFSELRDKVKPLPKLWEALLQRTTVVQFVVLKSVEDPRRALVVATTHLYWRPDADCIRLLHMQMCCAELEQLLVQERTANPDVDYSFLLCGDFNSVPDNGVPQFMCEGRIGPEHEHWSASQEGREEHLEGYSISHPFDVGSACGFPKYTTFTSGFADCIDYIFYPRDKFDVEEVIPFPTDEELQQHTAVPNVVFPSDHIACVAELKWK